MELMQDDDESKNLATIQKTRDNRLEHFMNAKTEVKESDLRVDFQIELRKNRRDNIISRLRNQELPSTQTNKIDTIQIDNINLHQDKISSFYNEINKQSIDFETLQSLEEYTNYDTDNCLDQIVLNNKQMNVVELLVRKKGNEIMELVYKFIRNIIYRGILREDFYHLLYNSSIISIMLRQINQNNPEINGYIFEILQLLIEENKLPVKIRQFMNENNLIEYVCDQQLNNMLIVSYNYQAQMSHQFYAKMLRELTVFFDLNNRENEPIPTELERNNYYNLLIKVIKIVINLNDIVEDVVNDDIEMNFNVWYIFQNLLCHNINNLNYLLSIENIQDVLFNQQSYNKTNQQNQKYPYKYYKNLQILNEIISKIQDSSDEHNLVIQNSGSEILNFTIEFLNQTLDNESYQSKFDFENYLKSSIAVICNFCVSNSEQCKFVQDQKDKYQFFFTSMDRLTFSKYATIRKLAQWINSGILMYTSEWRIKKGIIDRVQDKSLGLSHFLKFYRDTETWEGLSELLIIMFETLSSINWIIDGRDKRAEFVSLGLNTQIEELRDTNEHLVEVVDNFINFAKSSGDLESQDTQINNNNQNINNNVNDLGWNNIDNGINQSGNIQRINGGQFK